MFLNKFFLPVILRRFAVFVAMLFASLQTQAQQVEISSGAGYFIGGNVKTYYGEVDLGNNFNYGLSLDYFVNDNTFFEVFWFLNAAKATFIPYANGQFTDEFDLNTNYIQLGVGKEANPEGKWRPFGLVSAGTTIFGSDIGGTVWRLSFGLTGGLKYFFSDSFGLRAQTRFLVPMYFDDYAIWCKGSDCSYGVSAGTTVIQWHFSLGLIIAIL